MFRRTHRLHIRVGLRTAKTALAVVLAMLIITLIDDEVTIFPALAAMAVISPRFEDAVMECKNQAVGITIGGLAGILAVWIWPQPPLMLLGIGVIVIITTCTALHLQYSAALSSIIFIASCVDGAPAAYHNTGVRILHTAVGLIIGLAVNVLILPYDNRPQIVKLLRQACERFPILLREYVACGHYPDRTEVVQLIEKLHYEMKVYAYPIPFRRNRKDDVVWLQGCVQLAERMQQELYAILYMDAPGRISEENLDRLEQIEQFDRAAYDLVFQADEVDSTVLNYHLTTLLNARDYLLEMLKDEPVEKKK